MGQRRCLLNQPVDTADDIAPYLSDSVLASDALSGWWFMKYWPQAMGRRPRRTKNGSKTFCQSPGEVSLTLLYEYSGPHMGFRLFSCAERAFKWVVFQDQVITDTELTDL